MGERDDLKILRFLIIIVQPGICKELNIENKTTVLNWKNKCAIPYMKYLQMIINKFNISLNWFLQWKGKSSIHNANSQNALSINNNNNNNYNYNNNIKNIHIANEDAESNNINIDNNTPPPTSFQIQQLLELANLKKEGLLTDKEFQLIKQTLLNVEQN